MDGRDKVSSFHKKEKVGKKKISTIKKCSTKFRTSSHCDVMMH